MKYLKEEALKNRKGEVQKVATPKGDEELTLGLYLYLVLDNYVPTQDFYLVPTRRRLLDRILDKLEGEPEDGYWALEDNEFVLAKELFEKYAPRIVFLEKYTPLVEDKLNEAVSMKIDQNAS